MTTLTTRTVLSKDVSGTAGPGWWDRLQTDLDHIDEAVAVSLKANGAVGDGVADDLGALNNSWTAAGPGAVVYATAGTYNFSATTSPNEEIVLLGEGRRVTIFHATGSNYIGFRPKKSFICRDCSITRNDVAQDANFAAIRLAFGDPAPFNVPIAGTVLIVQDVEITGWDIGIYSDGEAAQDVVLAVVRDVRIQCNQLAPGTPNGVNPTVALNNCGDVRLQNVRLETPFTAQQANNAYFIGSRRVSLEHVWIFQGFGFKCVSNAQNGVDLVELVDVHFERCTQDVLVGADTNPVKKVTIRDCFFDRPRQIDAAVSGCIRLATYIIASAPAFDIEYCAIENNYFRDLQRGAVEVAMSTGHNFGTLVMDGNVYRNWSLASGGTYALVASGGAVGSTYGQIVADNEVCIGGGTGRCWWNVGEFVSQNIGKIIETGVTNVNQTPQNARFNSPPITVGLPGYAATLLQHNKGQVTTDQPSINGGDYHEFNVPVDGAAVGDVCLATPEGAIENGLGYYAYINAANLVRVHVFNYGAGAVNPASRTWYAAYWKHA